MFRKNFGYWISPPDSPEANILFFCLKITFSSVIPMKACPRPDRGRESRLQISHQAMSPRTSVIPANAGIQIKIPDILLKQNSGMTSGDPPLLAVVLFIFFKQKTFDIDRQFLIPRIRTVLSFE